MNSLIIHYYIGLPSISYLQMPQKSTESGWRNLEFVDVTIVRENVVSHELERTSLCSSTVGEEIKVPIIN